jgi:hypothetical protein
VDKLHRRALSRRTYLGGNWGIKAVNGAYRTAMVDTAAVTNGGESVIVVAHNGWRTWAVSGWVSCGQARRCHCFDPSGVSEPPRPLANGTCGQ